MRLRIAVRVLIMTLTTIAGLLLVASARHGTETVESEKIGFVILGSLFGVGVTFSPSAALSEFLISRKLADVQDQEEILKLDAICSVATVLFDIFFVPLLLGFFASKPLAALAVVMYGNALGGVACGWLRFRKRENISSLMPRFSMKQLIFFVLSSAVFMLMCT